MNLEKRNHKYIKGKLGDTNLIYTYSSNNKNFKVVENSSDNFDTVNSTIYIENYDGKFIEYATQKLTVENDEITITINENGIITTDKIKIHQETTSGINKSPSQPERNSDSLNALNNGPTWDGMPVSSWIYYGEYTGSSDITRYTSSAVIAILATVAASLFGIAGQCVVAGVAAIAGMIVDDAIPRIWWTDNVYYQTCIPPEEWMFRMKVAEYTHVHIFSSPEKTGTNLLGDYYYYYYDDLYVQ